LHHQHAFVESGRLAVCVGALAACTMAKAKGKGVFQTQFNKTPFGKGGKDDGKSVIDGSLKVWVGGLPEGISQEDVQTAFEAVGTVQKASMMKGNTACVAYTTAEEAQAAIDTFNGGDFNGSTLTVDTWTSKPADAKGKGKPADKGVKGAFQPAAKGAWQPKGVMTKGKSAWDGGKSAWDGGKSAWDGGKSAGWGKGYDGGKSFGKGYDGGKSSFKGDFKGDGKGKKGKSFNNGLREIDASLKVWVGGLPEDLTEEDMISAFSAAGTVTKAVKMGGGSKGTGAVCFSSAEEVEVAIQTFNGGDLNGSTIEVDVWTRKEPSEDKGKGKGKFDKGKGKGKFEGKFGGKFGGKW